MSGLNILASLHSPYVEPGNVNGNIEEHLSLIEKYKSDIHIFPELSISGYHCGDLFFNNNYIKDCINGIAKIHDKCIKYKTISIVGCPIEMYGSIYNCAVICGLNKLVARAKVELATSNEYMGVYLF